MSDLDLETLGTPKGFPDIAEDNACHHAYYPNQEINILGDAEGNRRETWQTWVTKNKMIHMIPKEKGENVQ